MPTARSTVVLLALAAIATLSACTPGALGDGDGATPAPSATETSPAPSPSASAPPDPSPSAFEPAPSAPPTVEPVAGDLDLACTDVLTLQQVYDFNPEMLATATPTSAVPSGLAAMASEGGVLCAWQHATSGDLLLVAVVPADRVAGDVDASPLASASAERGALRIVVASPYFEGADAEADAILEAVAANVA